jgi:hypothetical protein
MNNIQEYWADVRAEEANVRKAISESPSQPTDDSVYITSVKNRQANTIAGDVVLASIPIAAKCLVGGSHRLSNDEEIAAHRVEHARRKAVLSVATRGDQKVVLTKPAA